MDHSSGAFGIAVANARLRYDTMSPTSERTRRIGAMPEIRKLPHAQDSSSAPHDWSAEESEQERRARGQRLIELLDEWMADESGYDEETWPLLKDALERNRLSI